MEVFENPSQFDQLDKSCAVVSDFFARCTASKQNALFSDAISSIRRAAPASDCLHLDTKVSFILPPIIFLESR
jgi:hypothetical protein